MTIKKRKEERQDRLKAVGVEKCRCVFESAARSWLTSGSLEFGSRQKRETLPGRVQGRIAFGEGNGSYTWSVRTEAVGGVQPAFRIRLSSFSGRAGGRSDPKEDKNGSVGEGEEVIARQGLESGRD